MDTSVHSSRNYPTCTEEVWLFVSANSPPLHCQLLKRSTKCCKRRALLVIWIAAAQWFHGQVQVNPHRHFYFFVIALIPGSLPSFSAPDDLMLAETSCSLPGRCFLEGFWAQLFMCCLEMICLDTLMIDAVLSFHAITWRIYCLCPDVFIQLWFSIWERQLLLQGICFQVSLLLSLHFYLNRIVAVDQHNYVIMELALLLPASWIGS